MLRARIILAERPCNRGTVPDKQDISIFFPDVLGQELQDIHVESVLFVIYVSVNHLLAKKIVYIIYSLYYNRQDVLQNSVIKRLKREEQTKMSAKKTEKIINEAIASAEAKSEAAAEKARETTEKIITKTKTTAKKAAVAVKETTKKSTEKAKESAEKSKAAGKKTIDDAQKAVEEAKTAIKEQTAKGKQTVKKAKKVIDEVAKKLDETTNEITAAVTEKPAPAEPEIVIQSMMGGEISISEIKAKVAEQAGTVSAIYVKPEENKAYYVAADKNGSVDVW